MRMYQHYGLTGEADRYLEENCVKDPGIVCPECGYVVSLRLKILKSEDYDAFYYDGPTLHTFELKDGGKVKEVIQAMPWSSGPCGFLCLELEDGTRIGEWDEEVINHC